MPVSFLWLLITDKFMVFNPSDLVLYDWVDLLGTSLVAQTVKHLPTMTRVQSLGWEDLLEKEMATHSSYSCLEDPMARGVWRATVHGVTESWTWLSD